MKDISNGPWLLIALLSFGGGCAKVVPPYVMTADLVSLVPGMTLAEISKSLPAEPYDVYLTNENGQSIVVWYYKHPARLLTKGADTRAKNGIGGIEHVVDLSKAYMVFQDGRLQHIVTDEGQAVYREILDGVLDVRDNEKCHECDSAHSAGPTTHGGSELPAPGVGDLLRRGKGK